MAKLKKQDVRFVSDKYNQNLFREVLRMFNSTCDTYDVDASKYTTVECYNRKPNINDRVYYDCGERKFIWDVVVINLVPFDQDMKIGVYTIKDFDPCTGKVRVCSFEALTRLEHHEDGLQTPLPSDPFQPRRFKD